MKCVQWIILVGLLAGGGGACQKSAQLKLIDASVQKPSNVALYFTVTDKSGEPVGGILADKFNIYEDGKLISTYESKQTILNPEIAIERYTLLLLDMSGSIVESGQVPLIQEAVGAFTSGIGEQERVAIYAFDGRVELIEIANFESGRGQLTGGTNRLGSWKTEDPSTNLNGAVIEAAQVLTQAMESSEVPMRFGSLVLFTDGTDRAHRATSSDAVSAIADAELSGYVIGLGGEVDEEEMARLGPNGVVHVEARESVVKAFSDVADEIHKLALSHYLLSYCSPSRAGRHELEIEAVLGEDRGKLAYDFDAQGFEPDCDPNTKPAFEVPTVGSKKRGPKTKSKNGGAVTTPTKANGLAKANL